MSKLSFGNRLLLCFVIAGTLLPLSACIPQKKGAAKANGSGSGSTYQELTLRTDVPDMTNDVLGKWHFDLKLSQKATLQLWRDTKGESKQLERWLKDNLKSSSFTLDFKPDNTYVSIQSNGVTNVEFSGQWMLNGNGVAVIQQFQKDKPMNDQMNGFVGDGYMQLDYLADVAIFPQPIKVRYVMVKK